MMRKLSILGLALLLIFGMSFGVLACDHGSNDCDCGNGEENGECPPIDASDTTTATLTVCPYATIEFFDNDYYNGLFPEALEGMAGLYVSDGNATRNAANSIWGYDDGSGYTPGVMDSGSAIYNLSPTNNFVDPFVVDMNTPIYIDMAVNWDNWAKVPTLFRVSSDSSISYGGLGGNGIGSWGTNLAMVTNVNELVNEGANLLSFAQSSAFSSFGTMKMFDTFGEDGAFVCEGPFEFHLNAAVYLPKVGSIVAGEEYTADITMTVSAAPATQPNGQ